MKLFAAIKGFFGGTSGPESSQDITADRGALAEKLSEMRGDNITVVDSAGDLPINRDAMANVVEKAKDVGIVNTGGEGRSLEGTSGYNAAK